MNFFQQIQNDEKDCSTMFYNVKLKLEFSWEKNTTHYT